MTIIEDKAVAPSAKRWQALVPLVVAMGGVAVWVGNDTYAENGASVGFIVGNSAVISLMVWAALFFGFVKKTARKVGLSYWAILFATGIASGLAVSGYATMQARTATQSIAQTYEALTNGQTVDLNAKATGNAGQLEAWMKAYLAQQAKDSLAYENELDGSGVSNLLLPARLKADTDLSQSRAAVVRGRQIVKKYHSLFDRRVTEAYGLIDKTTMSPSMKAQAKAGMNESMATSKATTDRIWLLEAAAVDEMGAVVDLLAKSKGSWTITDRVVFQNPEVLSTYNAHLSKIQELANEENALRAEAQALSSVKMDQLQALTK